MAISYKSVTQKFTRQQFLDEFETKSNELTNTVDTKLADVDVKMTNVDTTVADLESEVQSRLAVVEATGKQQAVAMAIVLG